MIYFGSMLKKLFYTVALLATVFLLSCNSSKEKGQNRGASENILASPTFDSVNISPDDSLIFDSIMSRAKGLNLAREDLSTIIIHVARGFENRPYVAHTLEIEGPERLVINLREFDCTTFVENVLALSFCIKRQNFDLPSFEETLKNIRYRGGVINGYPSRLHYFSEWLHDNQEKGLIDIVSNNFGKEEFNAHVSFISQHADKYPKLKDDTSFVRQISDVEKQISQYDFRFLSEAQIAEKKDAVHDGDIIAFCSTIGGLDITHVALALHAKNTLHFIHASTRGNKVQVSAASLKDYVSGRQNVYGVLVARPKVD
jgi:hypothetical protein